MSSTHKWIRVNRAHPCIICDHDGWCSYCPGLNLALCMRIESNRPSKNAMGGWLWKLGETIADSVPRAHVPYSPPKAETPDPTIDFYELWKSYSPDTTVQLMVRESDNLGVSFEALYYLRARWSTRYNAWAYPMRNAERKIIGIRLRSSDGKKWAVKGSKQGLFVPDGYTQPDLCIAEGPTDTAAAMSLDFFAVGRPACEGGKEFINQFIRLNKVKRVIIIADNDAPGLRGAQNLQDILRVPSIQWSPPAKDVREFLKAGGTRAMIDSAIKDMIWTQPKETS